MKNPASRGVHRNILTDDEYDANQKEEDRMWELFDSVFRDIDQNDDVNNDNDHHDEPPARCSKQQQKVQLHHHRDIEPTKDTATKCSHCGSRSVDLVDGNYVCVECNTVVTRVIDCSPEWRFQGGGENNTRGANTARCCAPSTDDRMGAAMSMGSSSTHISGFHWTLMKVQTWNSMTHYERNLYHIFDSMAICAANNGISTCLLEEAKSLYKRVSEGRVCRGDNRKAFIACSIYIACATNGVPRTINEIASMFEVRTSSLTHACKSFQDMLRVNIASSKPINFVPRFCSKLGVSADIVAMCRHVISVADEMNLLTENTPPTLVASVIYMCCCLRNHAVCKKSVAEACHLSHVTITKCHKRLMLHVDAFFPPGLDLDAWLKTRT
jgi:transcription initiation factor TFIIB